VILRRVRRGLFLAIAIIVFVVLIGATYQGVATALERRQFPYPGRLVGIGDHQLHIHCSGEGRPTVVLEAPALGMSAAWGWVQPEIARLTRVCSYDRSGLGWSEAGDRRFNPSLVPDELHELLEQAREAGPYILAGQGLGAAFASAYAERYPADVTALVLIDQPLEGPNGDDPTPIVRASPWLARAGVLRATRMLSTGAAGLPPESAGPMRAFLNRPDHLTRSGVELSRWDEAVQMARAATLRDTIAVTRIDAAGQGRTALLTDPGEARPVTSAIRAAVARARSIRAATQSSRGQSAAPSGVR
jgi:pimeloyl-ACP methyl ester carboxylesterase